MLVQCAGGGTYFFKYVFADSFTWFFIVFVGERYFKNLAMKVGKVVVLGGLINGLK